MRTLVHFIDFYDKLKRTILINDFEIYIIEIKKAKETLKNNRDDKIAQWMSFVDNPNSMYAKINIKVNKRYKFD